MDDKMDKDIELLSALKDENLNADSGIQEEVPTHEQQATSADALPEIGQKTGLIDSVSHDKTDDSAESPSGNSSTVGEDSANIDTQSSEVDAHGDIISASENADAERSDNVEPPVSTSDDKGANDGFKGKLKRALEVIEIWCLKVLKTLGKWAKRTFFGASKEYIEEYEKKMEKLSQSDKLSVDKIESPARQAAKRFFRKPIAVISLTVLVAMFALVFIGSACMPLDLSYRESLHSNLAPGFRMLSVPGGLKNDIVSISGVSSFSVGLDSEGKVYVWGNTKFPNSATTDDMKDIPDELDGVKVTAVAAGADHAVAITEEGKVVCWGEYFQGQYGTENKLTPSMIQQMPDILLSGRINAKNVAQLVCGYQASAIVMKDGKIYCWGNRGSGATNMRQLASRTDVEKVAFLGSSILALLKDGTLWLGNKQSAFNIGTVYSGGKSEQVKLFADGENVGYLDGKKVVDVAATYSSIAALTEDGELIIAGSITGNSTNEVPILPADEHVAKIAGGAKHYTVITDKNNIYSFGSNALNQCDTSADTVAEGAELFVGSFQNYIVENGKLTEKWGLKGYLFGTDNLGRDIFARVINGGMTTMTIGAVAVIISAIIAIIVGCLSGYFGGKVDMILMRVTEVFGSIPFLPFALILSAIFAGSAVSENMRMFIIMVILGVLSWTGLAQMIRGQVLAEREKEFVLAAKAMGVNEGRIAFKHILPNIVSVILVSLTLDFAGCMLTESSLSYLGFGVQLPRPTWGNMLDGANNGVVIQHYWWQWLFPALFLLVTTIAINLIGDSLRDAMDPKSDDKQ